LRKSGKIFYGWVIVGISALVFALVRGVNDAFGVFFVAILEEFGWSRAALAGVFSCARLTEGSISVAVGMLSDRFGLRRLVPLSACLVAFGLILASYAQSLWMLYVAYGLVFAVGYCGVGELSHVPVISRWFVRQRGMAIGLAMAGMGLGILLVVPLAQTFILHFGWRRAYVALAIVVLVGIIPPTLLWQRERPEDMGLLPDGEQRPPPPPLPASAATPAMGRAPATEKEWTLRQALGSPALWMLFVVRILTPLGMMMVVPHHVVYLVGQGFDKLVAAFAFGSLGAFSFTGRILFGWLSDRLGTVQTMMLSYSISIVGTFLLLSLHNPAHTWLLWCHIVVYGIGFGARGPLTSALVTQMFHGRNWGAILGFLEIGSGLGGTLGPWLSGFLFDRTGSYTVSFSLSMVLLGLAIVCAWLAGRQWRAEARRRR
jgi:sugar phosphate permease